VQRRSSIERSTAAWNADENIILASKYRKKRGAADDRVALAPRLSHAGCVIPRVADSSHSNCFRVLLIRALTEINSAVRCDAFLIAARYVGRAKLRRVIVRGSRSETRSESLFLLRSGPKAALYVNFLYLLLIRRYTTSHASRTKCNGEIVV